MEGDKRYKRLILSLIGVFVFLAIVDIMYDDPFKATDAFPLYVGIYWVFAYALVIGMGFVYYLVTKDKSESIAVVVAFAILEYTGLEDIIYYIIKLGEVPLSMPHLFKHPIISLPAKAMGLTTVTGLSLLISVGIGITITIFVVRWLKSI